MNNVFARVLPWERGILLLGVSTCLAMRTGDLIIKQDVSFVLCILRRITYPHVAFVLLFRVIQAVSDLWFLRDISNAIKIFFKYPQDKPGKSTAIAALGGVFALFAYFEKKRKLLRQETRETGKQFQEDERRDLTAAENLVREAADHLDPNVRLATRDIVSKIADH